MPQSNIKSYRDLVLSSEADIKRITGYLMNVFIKQEKIVPFNALYGDGTIYRPFNRQGAEMIYNTLIETINDNIKL